MSRAKLSDGAFLVGRRPVSEVQIQLDGVGILTVFGP